MVMYTYPFSVPVVAIDHDINWVHNIIYMSSIYIYMTLVLYIIRCANAHTAEILK